ncbi:MAG: hypothetical protein Q9223_001491 [Gallowayella weberi]
MNNSRIFIRGLPPSMDAGDFHRHFSKQSDITDARLIPHRRIGYVGYKTPEDALKAVKYHNKSFINMSRIKVELARSVDQENALTSRDHIHNNLNGKRQAPDEALLQDEKISLKRKRDVEPTLEKDAKLREYLEVMQPASKSRTWADEPINRDKKKMAHHDERINVKAGGSVAVQTPIDASPQEVPEIQKKSSKDTEQPSHTSAKAMLFQGVPADSEASPAIEIEPTEEQPGASALADDDWLRSRTSRLLGLVDEDDLKSQDVKDPEAPPNRGPTGNPERPSSLVASDTGFQAAQDEMIHDNTDTMQIADNMINTIAATARLFVRNLPYTTTEGDIRQHFEQLGHGSVEEVHVPIDYKEGRNKGLAYIQYSDQEAAAKAQQDLDAKPFQGRLLHIIPAAAKRQPGLDEIAFSKLPLKKQQQIKRKATAASNTFNWNSMYMNADAVMSSISDRLGVAKSELLDPTSADAAVKQAHAETHIIQETKSYFSANGVNLDAFRRKERADNAILVKNFPYGTKSDELQKLFEVYGTVRRLIMPPSGTIAIVDFVQADHARSAFGGLAYRKFRESVLFLEKAPKDIFTDENVVHVGDKVSSGRFQSAKQSTGALHETAQPQQTVNTCTLFVRNLNFSTTSERLREVFQPLDGFLSARVKTKPDPKHAGNLLSMGFGFLEFKSKEQARAALAAMDGHNLDDHELLIRASHKGADAAEERRRDDIAKKLSGRRTKVVIKNLPFEASKKDVRSLFGAYGQLRSVRVPKKFDSSTRGFAFAEFVTAREAENAIDALKDTHLLGRRLVLDFANEDEIDPEHEIAKMQKKAGKQADKVALQRLVGTGRKKFNVGGNDDID